MGKIEWNDDTTRDEKLADTIELLAGRTVFYREADANLVKSFVAELRGGDAAVTEPDAPEPAYDPYTGKRLDGRDDAPEPATAGEPSLPGDRSSPLI